MTPANAPICIFCTHFRKDEDSEEFGFKCDAYPVSIPTDIIFSVVDHRKEFRGDNGILFDPVDDSAKEYAKRLFEGE